MANFKIMMNAYDKETFLDKKVLRFYIKQAFNQPEFVRKYKSITVASMQSELRAVGNYAVSNRTLRNHYKNAATQYLHDSINGDRSYIEDPSYSAIIY